MNHLYYGDNLGVLRKHIADESVDLNYLDPPFNSNASYNVLFRTPEGTGSGAQIEAFGDTWEWGEAANDAYREVLRSGTPAADMLAAMRNFLGENAMMAYLSMMAVRLIELHRVLKPTGSLYLHCDPDGANAPMGILVTLDEPTRPMREAAASYDHWETDWGPVPRVQIVTIEQLLTSPGSPVRLPVVRHDTHRKAAREERADRQPSLDL